MCEGICASLCGFAYANSFSAACCVVVVPVCAYSFEQAQMLIFME